MILGRCGSTVRLQAQALMLPCRLLKRRVQSCGCAETQRIAGSSVVAELTDADRALDLQAARLQDYSLRASASF